MTSIRILLFAVLLLPSAHLTAYGQNVKFGARASVGTGTITSAAMQTYFDVENAGDADIKRYDRRAKLGPVFSLGGFAEYALNEKISLVGEIAFQQQRSNLQIDLLEDNSQNVLSFRDEVESNNILRLSNLSVPLLARYYLKAKQGPYITGGFTADLVFGSTIEAEEHILRKNFDPSGALVNSSSETRVNKASIDEFGSPRVAFTIGMGTVLDAGPSGVTIDLRYNLGISKSRLYTTDILFDDQTRESDVFTIYKQADIALDNRIALNDFRTGTLLLTFGYRF